MSKVEAYRAKLRALADWDEYLLAESGLPGPRGNLELAQAAADEGGADLFQRYLQYGPGVAPVNTPGEFLAFCGVVGLGRLVAEGRPEYLETLRALASDPRWRIREGVAMALQRLGDADMDALVAEMARWSRGSALEQRAAAAALCEPRLLGKPGHALAALQIIDAITASIEASEDRKSEAFLALRKGLGYCWSVAVAAHPSAGKPLFERWLASPDPDIRWIVRENLRKNRLERMDAGWVERCHARAGLQTG